MTPCLLHAAAYSVCQPQQHGLVAKEFRIQDKLGPKLNPSASTGKDSVFHQPSRIPAPPECTASESQTQIADPLPACTPLTASFLSFCEALHVRKHIRVLAEIDRHGLKTTVGPTRRSGQSARRAQMQNNLRRMDDKVTTLHGSSADDDDCRVGPLTLPSYHCPATRKCDCKATGQHKK